MPAIPPLTQPKPVLVSTPPAPGVAPPLPAPVQARPKTVGLRAKALCSLPHRLLHPPPARGKVNTWGVVPRFEVKLDDVLDRKHLPPLGLKDFEEWLVYVEHSVENLYFILWLRQYTEKYSHWVRSTKLQRTSSYGSGRRRGYRTPSDIPPPKPELMFDYIRAKRTFLTPSAQYELDIPSDVLAPFHTPSSHKTAASPTSDGRGGEDAFSDHVHRSWSATTCAVYQPYEFGGWEGAIGPPPPDPAVFGEITELVREMLNESLQRFVTATFNNVGTPRAVCGSAGGIVIGLAGSVPLVVNFATGGSRWWRLAALPGMWLGLTIFISAMYGVCMMIYVFGDLRQLRSFELVRPPISDPQPHPSPSASVTSLFASRPAPAAPGISQLNPFRRPQRRSIPDISAPRPVICPPAVDEVLKNGLHTETAPPRLQIITTSRWSEESSIRPPQRAMTHTSRRSGAEERHVSRVSSLVSISDALEPSDEEDAHGRGYEDNDASEPCIEISDAFYDSHPCPEGPAMASFPGPGYGMRGVPMWPDYVGSEEEELNATAAFIHPFSFEEATKKKDGELDLEAQNPRGIAARQPMDPFDFDALPQHRPRFASGKYRGERRAPPAYSRHLPDGERRVRFAQPQESSFGPRAVLARWQTKCSPENVVRVHIEREIEHDRDGEKEKEGWGIGWGVASSPLAPSPTVTVAGSPVAASAFTFPAATTSTAVDASQVASIPTAEEPDEFEKENVEVDTDETASRNKQFRKMPSVPAFAVPLTPVLSPVVTRAQWEIVVRSALIAFAVCAVVVGGLTGAPVPHYH
ncbi:uncharacterized protein LAESUDRAFT_719991 [Laetiporus sulphureus 93-53]|uniref:RGS domain-containing protein n=1 Tax=Laetiporus sulphureus 93-53 TaxID=1314785 RepID=A0A165HPZ7_9APHY|nr:uncharacterized protein LAESUDRAFT_719991 [Laetiporus sulphureus 93-53]KZT12030.1 hypothetical protein LAESUDRAFT_719991 [Laetiporus sulphureus 93-53]